MGSSHNKKSRKQDPNPLNQNPQNPPEPKDNIGDDTEGIQPAGQTISVACDPGSDAASQISIALLSQKPVQSGAPLIEVLGPTEASSNQETPTNTNLEKFDAVINQLADEFLNMKKECESATVPGIEPIPNEPAPVADTGYVFDPDPAWGYIGAAAGGAGLLFILAKLFGGK